VRSEEDLPGEESGRRDWLDLVLPVLVLLVVVGIVCVLVFTGVVSSDQEHDVPGESTTTTPTIEIIP
jgi:hypothetical protein